MSRLLSVMVLMLSTQLTGCFDLRQTMKVDEAGNVKLKVALAMNTTLASAIALDKGVNSTSLCGNSE